MKRLIAIFILILLSVAAHATTWFATTSSANIDAVTWRDTQGASCAGSGATLTFASRANGDVFNSNGCTSIAVNVDPGSVSIQVTLTTDATNTGGGFTYATATNITMHAHIIAKNSATLTITGSTGGGTISGNITGPTAASTGAVTDSHTVVTITVNGTVTGGSGSVASEFGYQMTGTTGFVIINGNVTGGSSTGGNAQGVLSNQSSTGTVTVNGNCIGGTGAVNNQGCQGSNTTPLIVVGSSIASLRNIGVAGSIRFTPAATNYVLMMKDTSYVTGVIDSHATEMPTDPGVTNVLLGVTYGSFTGTLASGSGSSVCSGSWQ